MDISKGCMQIGNRPRRDMYLHLPPTYLYSWHRYWSIKGAKLWRFRNWQTPDTCCHTSLLFATTSYLHHYHFALNYLTLVLGPRWKGVYAAVASLRVGKRIINVNLEGLALVACSCTRNDDGYGACIRDKASHEGDGTDINCISSRPCFYTCWKNVFTTALLQKNKAYALFSVSYCFIVYYEHDEQ